MKQKNNLLEFLIWAVALVPLAYLLISWQEMPDRVPIHFNLEGEADDWGSKNFMAGMILLLTLGMNLLLLVIPNIDPKEKLSRMGNKYQQLRFLLSLFMESISVFIVYSAKSGSL